MENVIEGLKRFIRDDLMSYDDTWIVTLSDVLGWIQNPKSTASMQLEDDQWGCSDHREYHKCVGGTPKNSSVIDVSLQLVFDTTKLWIYQAVVLVLVYITVVRYDRNTLNRHHNKVHRYEQC
jgi:hypothetical protein